MADDPIADLDLGEAPEAPKPVDAPPAIEIPAFQLSGEHSIDEIMDLQFHQQPLSFLTRDDLVFEGTSMLLAAREKAGKSTLMRHLCQDWVMEGRRVLYLSEEWARVWQRQLQALGFEKGMGGHFQIIEALGKSPAELLRRAQTGPEEIIVLDTCTWLLGVNLSHREALVEALKPWVSLCGTGKTIMLLAHLTKSGRLEGSHAFGAGVDAIITYNEAGGVDTLRRVDVRSRMHTDVQAPFGVRKVGSNFVVEELPHEQTVTHAEAEVLEVLPEAAADGLPQPEGLTWKDICKATGFKESKVRLILRHLIGMKLVKETTGNLGSGGRGNIARYLAVLEEA